MSETVFASGSWRPYAVDRSDCVSLSPPPPAWLKNAFSSSVSARRGSFLPSMLSSTSVSSNRPKAASPSNSMPNSPCARRLSWMTMQPHTA